MEPWNSLRGRKARGPKVQCHRIPVEAVNFERNLKAKWIRPQHFNSENVEDDINAQILELLRWLKRLYCAQRYSEVLAKVLYLGLSDRVT